MNPPKDIKSTNSEPILSPLHKASVGTTTMPIKDPSSERKPIFHTPQEQSNMPTSHNSTLLNCMEQPLPLSSLLPHTVPTNVSPVSSVPFRFTANSSNQQETFSSEHNFLTTPVSDYLSFSDSMAIMSMDAPPITSLLQGDPTAVLHAHLNTIQGSDLGPIFEDPTLVPMKETIGASDKVVQGMSSSMMKSEGDKDIYECKICSAKFFSPQALGGHMSHHSKAKKKEGKSTASTGTN
ncbi:unnamed protein product [Urochloa decumbens]|uniref:C2H2-type domain-containing protein n=1 Tax=Urochloa decumbens TaxID=240449 RepID=A0ABC8YTP2_9POAL